MKWSGTRQRQQREKTGFSTHELAKWCKVSQGNIAQLERGICQPRVGTALRIAYYLRKPLEFFIDK